MPLYRITAPDGNTYQIEGPAGASQMDVVQAILAQNPQAGVRPEAAQAPLAAPEAPKERPGLTGSFMEAAKTVLQGDEAAAFAANPTRENRKAFLEAAKSKYESVGGFGKGENWEAFKELLGGSLGYMAAPIAAGAVTGGVGGFGTLFGQYNISNLLRQAEEQEAAELAGEAVPELSLAKAVTASAGQTALDVVGFKAFKPLFSAFPLTRNLVGKAGGKAAKESADALAAAIKKGEISYANGIARYAVKGTAVEIPQEMAQTALERWQAGLSLTDEEAQEEFAQAALGAAVLGPIMGGPAGALQIRSGRKAKALAEGKGEKEAEDEADKAAEEAAAQNKAALEVAPPPYVGTPEYEARVRSFMDTNNVSRDIAEEYAAAEFEGGTRYETGESVPGGDESGIPVVKRKAGEEPAAGGAATTEAGGLGGLEPTAIGAGVGAGVGPRTLEDARNEVDLEVDENAFDYGFDEGVASEEVRTRATEILLTDPNATVSSAVSKAIETTPVENRLAPTIDVSEPTKAAKKLTKAETKPVTLPTAPAIEVPEGAAPEAGVAPEAGKLKAAATEPLAPTKISVPQAAPIVEGPALQDALAKVETASADMGYDFTPEQKTTIAQRVAQGADLIDTMADVDAGVIPTGEGITELTAEDLGAPAVEAPGVEEVIPEEKPAAKPKKAKLAETPEAVEDIASIVRSGFAEADKFDAPFIPAFRYGVENALLNRPAPSAEQLQNLGPAWNNAFKAGKQFALTRAKEAKAAREEAAAQAQLEPTDLSFREIVKLAEKMASRDGGGKISPAQLGEIRRMKDSSPEQVMSKLREFEAEKSAVDYGKEVGFTVQKEGTRRRAPRKPNAFGYYSKTDPDPKEAADVQSDVEGKSFDEVLDWLVAKAPNEYYKVIAQAIRAAAKAMQNIGFKYSFKVVHVGDKAPKGMNTNRAMTFARYSERQIDVMVNGVDVTNKVGTSYETILHEYLHATTMALVKSGNLKAVANTQIGRAVSDLYDVFNKVVQHIEAKVAADPSSLNDFELGGVKRAHNAFTDPNEFIGWGLSNPKMQEYLASVPYDTKETAWSKFVDAIRKLFGLNFKYKTALAEVMRVSEQIMLAPEAEMRSVIDADPRMTTVEAPMATPDEALAMKDESDEISANMRKVKAGTSQMEVVGGLSGAIKARKWGSFKAALKRSTSAFGQTYLGRFLRALPSSAIIDWIRGLSPQVGNVAAEVRKTVQLMGAMTANFLERADVLAKKVDKFAAEFGQVQLGETMHLARLNHVSPTENTRAEALAKDPVIVKYTELLKRKNLKAATRRRYQNLIADRKREINEVYNAWDALGKQKGGQDLYRELRQFYKNVYTASRVELNGKIKTMFGKAEAATLIDQRNKLEQEAMNETHEKYEEVAMKELPSEYFPFKRHGDYWLRIEKPFQGMDRQAYAFDTAAEREEMLAKLAQDQGFDPESDFVKLSNASEVREKMVNESAFLSKMFAEVKKAKLSDVAKGKYKSVDEATEALKKQIEDQIYQTWFMTLPERSIRKQFIHAKNIAGFSGDVARNFKTSANAAANQLAKARYGSLIEKKLSEAYEATKTMPPQMRLKINTMLDELSERARNQVSPPEQNAFVTGLNRFSFLWLLTSGATAAVQFTSIPIRVFPALGSRYGVGPASAMWAKYLKLWDSVGITRELPDGSNEYVMPSMENSDLIKNNPLLKKAMQAAKQRGVFMQTQTSSVTNTGPTISGLDSSKVMDKTAKVMSAAFQASEQITREAAFMMQFELEYNKTKNFDKSVEVAIEGMENALGDYTEFERPSVLNMPVARAVFLFKMYSVVTTKFFLNSVNNMLRGESPEVRVQAFNELSGVLLMGALFHGVVGMPLYGVVSAAIDKWLELFEDDDDSEARRFADPHSAMDSDFRFRFGFMERHFGQVTVPGLGGNQVTLADMLTYGPISALSDANIGSRTTFDGLWFREGKAGGSTHETVVNFLLANLGPSVSLGENAARAVDDFNKGEVMRGMERILPAFFKAPLTAYRLGTEGAETRGGAALLEDDEIGNATVVAQAFGFQPMRLTERQKQINARRDQKIKQERMKSDLLRRRNEIMLDGDATSEDLERIEEEITAYNSRYPAYKMLITDETKENSLDAYLQKRGMTIYGSEVTEESAPYDMPSIMASIPTRE